MTDRETAHAAAKQFLQTGAGSSTDLAPSLVGHIGGYSILRLSEHSRAIPDTCVAGFAPSGPLSMWLSLGRAC